MIFNAVYLIVFVFKIIWLIFDLDHFFKHVDKIDLGYGFEASFCLFAEYLI